MANNYTQTTVEPSNLTLTPVLKAALEAVGARIEGGEEDTTLDQVVRGDRNVHDVYVFFEDGFREYEEGFSDLDTSGLNDEECAEVERLLKLDEVHLLREVLLANPEVKSLEVKSAYYCSKMRPGEFGGGGLYITRSHYCYVGDNSAEVQADGTIKVTAVVEKFDAAPPV